MGILKKLDNRISIGNFTYGVENVKIFFANEDAGLQIGKFCSLAGGIKVFLGGNHRVDWVSTYPFGHIHPEVFGERASGHPTTKGDILIGNDVWIGAGTSIMSGVTIGNGAVICAESHVVKDVDDYEIVGGNPAQHIKYRFSRETIERLLDVSWWDLPIDEIKKMVPTLCAEPKQIR